MGQVMQFCLVPASSAASKWKAYGAGFGKVSARKGTILGPKQRLLFTLSGLITSHLSLGDAPARSSLGFGHAA